MTEIEGEVSMENKEQALYLEIWDRVSEDVKALPKESVVHITNMVKLMMEREDQVEAAKHLK